MPLCQRCKTEFNCGMSDLPNATPCWCTTLPVLPRSEYKEAAGCYCPRCLRELVEAARRSPA